MTRRDASPPSPPPRWSPWRCSGVFFVLPGQPAWSARGFVQDGHLDIGGVARRPRPGPRSSARSGSRSGRRPLATLLACALGLPGGVRPPSGRDPRPHLGPRAPGRALRAARPSWSASPSSCVIGDGGPLAFLGLDGSPVAIIAGLVFFNASVVIRVVGGAWESLDPRPAEAAAALGRLAAAGAARRDLPRPAAGDRLGGHGRVPLLCDRVRDRADARRAALLQRRDPDLPAHHQPPRPPGRGRPVGAPARSWSPALLVAAARARRTPDATVARSQVRLRRPTPRRPPRPRRDRRARSSWWSCRSRSLVVAVPPRRRRLEPGQLPRPPDPGLPPGAARPGHRRARELLRIAVDATWMSLLLGLSRRADRHPPLAHPLRATAPRRPRRAVHAAARRLRGDPRLRLPDHPRAARRSTCATRPC